jgi:16S rRNA (uracil1498-N3)-methyltransferase
VAAIQPLQCARSVLKLAGERAERRQAHWQAVAVAAAEQSGRTQVPSILAVCTPAQWLATLPAGDDARLLLCFAADAHPVTHLGAAAGGCMRVMSGPEGGLTPEEEALARRHGFQPLSLGPRVLRADTAPLAVLALLGAGG